MIKQHPQGSLWYKWDLHVHTTASLVHFYPGNEEQAWDAFFTDLENLPEEFKVVGINDYLFLDGYEKVLEAHTAGRMENIALFLPVIELRLKIFGGTESKLSKVNYHVIFSDDMEPQVIREQFSACLSSQFQLEPRYKDTGIESVWSGTISKDALENLGKAILASGLTSALTIA